MSYIRVIFGLTTCLDLKIEKLNVKTLFLHEELEEEIYMQQSEGFEEPDNEYLVCSPKKSLYELK